MTPTDRPERRAREEPCPHCGNGNRLILTSVMGKRVVLCACMLTEDAPDASKPYAPGYFAPPAYWRRRSPDPAAQAAAREAVALLQHIIDWRLPPSGRTWQDTGRPMSYGQAFGSNGERDYMRDVARRAALVLSSAVLGDAPGAP